MRNMGTERTLRMAQLVAIGRLLRKSYKAEESEPVPDRLLRLLDERGASDIPDDPAAA
jgi:hypothetical protein